MKPVKNITIIGNGLMGCGCALVFAQNTDFNVTIKHRSGTRETIHARIMSFMVPLIEKGIYSQAEAEAIIGRVHTEMDLAESVKDADLVMECIAENMQLKQDQFAALEPLTRPDTIYATNTSVMSITAIASKTVKKDRVVGTHFWNPPYLIPLVEVVKASETSEDTMERTLDCLLRAGKKAIRCNKDVPGFVANRMQHALWREAISIVAHGIADAATVDEAVRSSFGLRLPVLGPMENADMVGTDLTLSIHEYMLQHLESDSKPSPILYEKVAAGELGFKTQKGFQEWNDEKIAESRRKLSEHLIKMLYDK
ncbi:MAG: 3-hydroxyacyl-CoA dehydrogenase family protein [Saccharofermentanales bacterium]